LNVHLVKVELENETKGIKKATVEFVKSDGSAYLTWKEFNLNDQKERIRLPDGSGDFAVVCTGMPSVDDTNEWVKLQVWKSSG